MTIGFIGGGNMATALISGLISSQKVKPEEIYVYDVDAEKLEAMKNELKINSSSSVSELEQTVEIVVLSVKPNIMPVIFSELEGIDSKLYISIAAGITLESLAKGIGADKRIIRTMPNTPALVGCGMTVITPNANVSPSEVDMVEDLLSGIGDTVRLDEKYMNAAIALHSSSPAYIYMLIDAMADSGVKYGLPKNVALKLAAKAVEGSAKMVLESDEHPMKLKDNVCSPGGTTIAAVCDLESSGFRASIQSAIDACIQKADNMSK